MTLRKKIGRSKYGNIKTAVDGIVFDSRKEANRYSQLRLLERDGQISGLILQPVFLLEVNGQKICKYIADFGYIENKASVIEDAKGVKTPAYRLKKKLLRALYGIEVREI